MKPEYRCKLLEICMQPTYEFMYARIIRLEDHVVLGPPGDMKLTITSKILNIDWQRKKIETLNSIYNFADESASAPSCCGAEKIVMEAAVREGCTPAHASRIARRASSDDFTDAEYTGAIERIYDHSLEVAAKLRSENEAMRAEIAALRAPASAPSCCGEDNSTLIKRLRNPPFGTETSERNLMTAAADALDARAQPCQCGASSYAKYLLNRGVDDLGRGEIDRLLRRVASAHPCRSQAAEGWVYKTYRVEWVAQTGHVDQYGREFKPDYERAFPTRDEALEHMKTIATYDERLMRWVTGKPYHQGEVSYREALAATAPRSGDKDVR